MNRAITLYIVAWIAVPIAFAAYVSLAYSYSLAHGDLPFLGAHEWRWWTAIALALVLGTICISRAHPRSGMRRVMWPLVYVLVMSLVLVDLHVAVACGHGDCL
jgi:hypothetical protein